MAMSDLTDWLPLRFRDLDAFGHVYHAEYLTLLDEARTRWFENLGPGCSTDYVMVRMEIDWVSSLGPQDTAVRVDFGVQAVGTKSVTLLESMRARDGRLVARSRSVVVRWDVVSATSRALVEADRIGLDTRRVKGWS
jgi:acyl-CoA thioester hydrolase